MQHKFWTTRSVAGLSVIALYLSTQIGSCVKPDLVVDRYTLRTSVLIERDGFTQSDCDYVEGCLSTAGVRKLLKCDVGLANVGKGDLIIGDPAQHMAAGDGLFVWSPCHQHYHMKTMVKYRVLNLDYSPVTRGRKQAFCLRDNYPYTSNAGDSSGFTCNYQGITAGWEDVYDKSLACQYVDITGVPPGQYYLEVEVNPLHLFNEATYMNNKVIVLFTVPYLNQQ